MANVIHLVIRVHIDRQQPEEEQHFGRFLSHCSIRQVRPSRITVRLYVNFQTLLRIQQIQVVFIVVVTLGYRVQQLFIPVELSDKLVLCLGGVKYLSRAY